jgi:hypothetical protein
MHMIEDQYQAPAITDVDTDCEFGVAAMIQVVSALDDE